jgi:hypothetical protein
MKRTRSAVLLALAARGAAVATGCSTSDNASGPASTSGPVSMQYSVTATPRAGPRRWPTTSVRWDRGDRTLNRWPLYRFARDAASG